MKNQLSSSILRLIDTVLPPRCVLTGEIVDSNGKLSPAAWGGLDFISRPFCNTCGIPFDFEVEQDGCCISCLDRPPPFKTARAAVRYNDTSRDLILGFKHADKLHIVEAFVPWMMTAGRKMLKDADMLIPVPLHRRRLLSRRYNQAAILSDALSRKTNIPSYPLAMRRTRSTQSQGHLTAGERHKNVKEAFDLHPAYTSRIKGKTVILIDDVYTTGATVKECTKTLRKSSADDVHILTLARVVREGMSG